MDLFANKPITCKKRISDVHLKRQKSSGGVRESRTMVKTAARLRSHSNPSKLLRVAGLPAVAALFSVAPERVQRLFFDQRMKPHVVAFCAQLVQMHKPYRLVHADELGRIAGSIMHGGVVAIALPRPLPILIRLRFLNGPSTADCCSCSTVSETPTILEQLPEPPRSSACRGSSFPIIPPKRVLQMRATASPKEGWST